MKIRNSRRIRIEDAAWALGISPQSLRVGLQQKAYDFGTAIKTSDSRYVYTISPDRLKEYIGDEIYLDMEKRRAI